MRASTTPSATTSSPGPRPSPTEDMTDWGQLPGTHTEGLFISMRPPQHAWPGPVCGFSSPTCKNHFHSCKPASGTVWTSKRNVVCGETGAEGARPRCQPVLHETHFCPVQRGRIGILKRRSGPPRPKTQPKRACSGCSVQCDPLMTVLPRVGAAPHPLLD